MASFARYAPLLKLLEGGFVDDPYDSGGATMRGVTLTTYRKYCGRNKTVEQLKNISDADWSKIMKSGYWDKIKADQIASQGVAEIFADWVVNSGPRVIKKVQALLRLNADGIVGPQTLRAINTCSSQRWLFDAIMQLRVDHYNAIVRSDPTQARFLKGWMNRLAKFSYKP